MLARIGQPRSAPQLTPVPLAIYVAQLDGTAVRTVQEAFRHDAECEHGQRSDDASAPVA